MCRFVALQRLAEAASSSSTSLPLALREVLTAGEQLQVGPALVRLFEQLPACTLHNQYGPTETHVVTEYTLAGPAALWPALPPIGRPIDDCHVYVLDEQRQPVVPGAVGELYLGGACLAQGYLHRPDLTAERFVAYRQGSGAAERLYKTGDLVRLQADGELAFLGRSDHQVKIRGYRIEPGEIEVALLRHPHLREAVVHARPDHTGLPHLVAYVVAEPGSSLHSDSVRHFLADILPDYMLPSAVVFLASLPLTPSGKVDRGALPAPAAKRPISIR
ncbi:MAG: AMP-binding protein, partial [Blastochloris sp.]|nr:AMP-binding protein [Blastochloris sp.]